QAPQNHCISICTSSCTPSKRRNFLRKYLTTTAGTVLLLFALTFFTWGSTALAAPTTTAAAAPKKLSYVNACATVQAGYARCLALVATLQGSNIPLSVHP